MAKTNQAAADPASTSPARHDLSEALLDLRAAERKAAQARAPVARLEAEIATEAAARRKLEAIDADYAARMAEWGTSGTGAAPTPDIDARHAAQSALDAAALTADAARGALSATQAFIAAADAAVGAARTRVKPAVAGVLREDGGWMVAEYWRRYGELEEIRRDLAALDQILLTDFPISHAPTGRTIINWISPDKLPGQAALKAIDAACAGLAGVQDFTRRWRERAEELGR